MPVEFLPSRSKLKIQSSAIFEKSLHLGPAVLQWISTDGEKSIKDYSSLVSLDFDAFFYVIFNRCFFLNIKKMVVFITLDSLL